MLIVSTGPSDFKSESKWLCCEDLQFYWWTAIGLIFEFNCNFNGMRVILPRNFGPPRMSKFHAMNDFSKVRCSRHESALEYSYY